MDYSHQDTYTHEELMGHVSWVQGLARRLVTDPHQAEELAQESMLAILRQPREPDSPRRFLARVARNLAYLGLRRHERRSRREAAVARPEATPSTFDELEQRTTQGLVIQAIRALPEHYAQVLLLRYFEDLTPTAIADRLDIPVSTVKTRLARAQARLRERLDRMQGGDGRGWLTCLLPLLGTHRSSAVARTSGSLPSAALLTIGATLVGVVAWVLTWSHPTAAQRPGASLELPRTAQQGPGLASPSRSPVGLAGTQPAPAATDASDNRFPQHAQRPSAGVAPRATLGPGVRLRGRVLDSLGNSLPSLLVRMRPYDESATQSERISLTDAEGAFFFESYWPGGTIEVVSEGWSNVMVGETDRGDPTSEVLVIAARRRVIQGHVLDARASPVALASISLRLPPSLRSGFEQGLGRSSTLRYSTRSGDLGEFALEVPDVPGAELLVHRAGFLERSVEAPAPSSALRIFLDRPLPESGRTGRIRGRVLAPDGSPRPGALVTNGQITQPCARGGEFELPRARAGHPLVAFAPGEGVAAWRPAPGDSEIAETVDVELRLEPALAQRGRVVGLDGIGIGGLELRLVNATACAAGVEGAETASRAVHPAGGANASVAELPESTPAWVERSLAGVPNDGPDAVTAADGSFQLRGLLDREYALEALEPTVLVRSRLRFSPAPSSELVLTLDRSALHGLLRGRVVDGQGRPMQGLDVRVASTASLNAPLHSGATLRGPTVKTDERGTFLLPGVPLELAQLEVSGTGVLTRCLPLENVEGLTIAVELAAYLRVELGAFHGDEQVRVLDPDGDALALHRPRGVSRLVEPQAALHQGRSERLAVSARGSRIVIYRQGQPWLEEELVLQPGEETLVRLHHAFADACCGGNPPLRPRLGKPPGQDVPGAQPGSRNSRLVVEQRPLS